MSRQIGMAIALHGYYDGTGSPANLHHGRIIGLAGYAATPEVWKLFEADWWKVLSNNSERPVCHCLHTTDAMALQCEFSPENGWTAGAVQSLFRDLFNTCFSPRGHGSELQDSVVGAACSVDLSAYERVCEEFPHFSEKAPEALCVDHVVTYAIKQIIPLEFQKTGMYMREIVEQGRSIALFFDRNEPFRHQIARVYEAYAWHRRPMPLRLVHSISQTDRESSAALQAADFLAWHLNRDASSVSGDLNARLTTYFAGRCYPLHYDYDELKETAKKWTKDGGYGPSKEG